MLPYRKQKTLHGISLRRGLAPLEFVLSLPILLFVMALIVNFGNMACWKVRGATVARQAVWRQRFPRTGAGDPRMPEWPATASLNVTGAGSFINDPFVPHTVVRGPRVVEPDSGRALTVETRLLDFDQDLKNGRSEIERRGPLLPGLGTVRTDLRHPLLDSRWQFGNMGIPWNDYRRIPYLYPELDPRRLLRFAPQTRQRFVAARNDILTAPFKPALNPLDRDEEFFQYYRQFDSEYRPPDFHPRLDDCRILGIRTDFPRLQCAACELDPATVHATYIVGRRGIINRIQGPRGGGAGGVPDRMARAFIRLYRDQLNELQAQLDALQQQVPPPLGQIQAIQSQMQPLQTKVDQLNAFLGTLF